MTITLITGADKGLGRETARRLIEAGHLVYIGTRDPERGSAAARDLGAGFVAINVLDEASVAAAVATVEREHGVLDVLVNNAGIAGGFTPPAETTAEQVPRVYDTSALRTRRASIRRGRRTGP